MKCLVNNVNELFKVLNNNNNINEVDVNNSHVFNVDHVHDVKVNNIYEIEVYNDSVVLKCVCNYNPIARDVNYRVIQNTSPSVENSDPCKQP